MRAPLDDVRLVACLDAIRRTGCLEIDVRYSDDEEPVVWFVVAHYPRGGQDVCETAASLDPVEAAWRLLKLLISGRGRQRSLCVHCKRPADVSEDWQGRWSDDKDTCWWVYDPELQVFRRSCEGKAKVDRNAPCPCGSGRKFKRCHGSVEGPPT